MYEAHRYNPTKIRVIIWVKYKLFKASSRCLFHIIIDSKVKVRVMLDVSKICQIYIASIDVAGSDAMLPTMFALG